MRTMILAFLKKIKFYGGKSGNMKGISIYLFGHMIQLLIFRQEA